MLSISPSILKEPATYRGMGLVALAGRLDLLKAAWRESRRRLDVLSAEYEATLPPIPEVLFYTKRDSFLFYAPWEIGAPLPKRVNYFRAALKSKTGCYHMVGGEITFSEIREAKARAKEIVRACDVWERTQKDHSRKIGLTGLDKAIGDVGCQIADLCMRIAGIRAQSLDGLKMKAIALRDLDFDSHYIDLIRKSIVRDLNSMMKPASSPIPAPAATESTSEALAA